MSHLARAFIAGLGAGMFGTALGLSLLGTMGLSLIVCSILGAIHASTQRKEAA